MMIETSMLSEEIIRIANHEAWIERKSGFYLKWGHYPSTDGKLDPRCVRAFAICSDGRKPVAVGFDGESSRIGGLFLEFASQPLAVVAEYDRGVYSVTKDGKWVFGDRFSASAMGYEVLESRWICGIAKIHIATASPLGLEFEIVPDSTNYGPGDIMRVQLLFRGSPVSGELSVRNSSDTFTVKANGFAEIELEEGVNVVAARYVEEIRSPSVDRRSITTTLSVVV